MIPRYDGLVPAIRGPASSATAAAASTSSKTSTTVERYVIRPTCITEASFPATKDRVAAEVANFGEPECRLYAFTPSVDAAVPPRELRVASRFFAKAVASPQSAADEDNDATDEDVGDGDSEVSSEGVPEQQQQQQEQQQRAGASNFPSHTSTTASRNRTRSRRRRRRRRGLEPMRLEYQGTMDTQGANAAGGQVIQMASTPAAGYKHLTCVLIELPTTWRESQSDDASSASSPSVSNVVPATALVRPVLQLWGERGRASDAEAEGISSSWSSGLSTRISAKDWKTMDAADAEMHKPTNWSDDDGGGGGDGGEETTRNARDRKRAKAEATSQSVRTFLAGTKAALHQQNSTTEDVTAPLHSTAAQVAAKERRSDLTNNAPLKTEAGTTTPVAMQPPLPTAAGGAAKKDHETPVTVALPSPRSPPARVNNAATVRSNTAAVAVASTASLTLPELAATVLREIQQTEARATAPLMELQKRIFKQLPDFSVMNQKIKSPDTKKEAVGWFQTCQRELRVWLQGHGHMIASDNIVTFGGWNESDVS